MRVLLVLHGFPPTQCGGTELYAHDLAMTLDHRFGHEVSVLAREADPRRPELALRHERCNGLRVTYINNTFKHCRSFEQTYRHDGVLRAAAHLMDQVEPEVVHFHHLTGLSTDLVTEAHRRGLPTLYTLHDYWLFCQRGQLLDLDLRRCQGPLPDRCARCVGLAAGVGPATFLGASLVRRLETLTPASGRLARRAAERASRLWTRHHEAEDQMSRRLRHARDLCRTVTRLLAPSRSLMQQFLDFGVPDDRIQLLPLGMDPLPFAHLKRRSTEGPLRLGFVGSLMPSKGPDLLLEAFSRLPAGQATLSLFGGHQPYHGDDSFRQRLRPLLDQPGVVHHGAVPHPDIPRVLANLDVLVVPSTFVEIAPRVVQEAFLAGVPVVASRLGGLCEMVRDGQDGLLFTPGDPDDLSRILRRFIEEPGLLDTLRRGLPSVRSLEEDARCLSELYSHVCRSSAQSRLSTALPAAAALPRKPPLAAVVLNYGTPTDTIESVQALQNSHRPIDDIIVVDNGSKDNSETLLRRSLPGVTVLQTGQNIGFSAGNNLGIRLALKRGARQVLLVNSDVTLHPDCVGRLEEALLRNRRWGVAGPRVLARSAPHIIASLGIRFSPTTGRMRHLGFGQDVGGRTVPSYREVDGVSGCAMLIRGEVLDQIGLLSEDYFFSFEDLDYCLRAREVGFRTVCVGGAAAFHEGGRSIGKRSPRRIYFATRNHLLLMRSVTRSLPPLHLVRSGFILGLNLAHVLLTADTPRLEGLAAMCKGVWHHLFRRYGDGP